jgi:peptidoglycan/xylan/chitin deacetylase (PgdA/CDA1 family)
MKRDLVSNIDINFDSLGWALQTNPREFEDPTFFSIADRFLKLSEKYDFKYTIFVIGKDLENPAVAKAVREWQDLGHEIGNHTYNHKPDFGSLSYEETAQEVVSSHEIIRSACKKDPRGFIAPGWAISKNLIKILIEKNYLYDTSLFPSWFMYMAQMKFLWNFKWDKRRFDIFRRTDYAANLLGNSRPFFSDGNALYQSEKAGRLLILPLPVTKLSKIPCWHTMKFMLPSPMYDYSLNRALQSDYFYYLIHPTDLMDLTDVPTHYQKKVQILERINVPLNKKMEMLEKTIQKIKKHSSRMVTLSEMSSEISLEHKRNVI